MNYEIRRLDLMSVLKVSFLIYLVIGFLIGMFYALIITQMLALFSSFMGDQAITALGKIGGASIFIIAIVMAVFMAVLWSILTVIAAALYNLLAGSFGGIKVELAEAQGFKYIPPAASPPLSPSGGAAGT